MFSSISRSDRCQELPQRHATSRLPRLMARLRTVASEKSSRSLPWSELLTSSSYTHFERVSGAAEMQYFFLSLAIFLPQTHVPSLSVSGSVVTIDADVAWITAAPPEFGNGSSDMIQDGTVLQAGLPLCSASYDGERPIVWSLPPGDYQIHAFGFLMTGRHRCGHQRR